MRGKANIGATTLLASLAARARRARRQRRAGRRLSAAAARSSAPRAAAARRSGRRSSPRRFGADPRRGPRRLPRASASLRCYRAAARVSRRSLLATRGVAGGALLLATQCRPRALLPVSAASPTRAPSRARSSRGGGSSAPRTRPRPSRRSSTPARVRSWPRRSFRVALGWRLAGSRPPRPFAPRWRARRPARSRSSTSSTSSALTAG